MSLCDSDKSSCKDIRAFEYVKTASDDLSGADSSAFELIHPLPSSIGEITEDEASRFVFIKCLFSSAFSKKVVYLGYFMPSIDLASLAREIEAGVVQLTSCCAAFKFLLQQWRTQKAILILEKNHFEKDTPSQLFTSSSFTTIIFSPVMINSIYGEYILSSLNIPEEMTRIKVNIIYPADERTISKYTPTTQLYFNETSFVFNTAHFPLIRNVVESGSLQWVHNILLKKKEMERWLLLDSDPELGFVLLPDTKWLSESVNAVQKLIRSDLPNYITRGVVTQKPEEFIYGPRDSVTACEKFAGTSFCSLVVDKSSNQVVSLPSSALEIAASLTSQYDIEKNEVASDLAQIYYLAIINKTDIYSLRSLTTEHVPLLENMYNCSRAAIACSLGIPIHQIVGFVHYPPTFYHLHVHFVHVSSLDSQNPARCVFIPQILANIRNLGNYYQTMDVDIVISAGLLAESMFSAELTELNQRNEKAILANLKTGK